MAKKYFTFCFLFFFSTAFVAEAQEKIYLVRFKDKTNSRFSTSRPLEFLSQRAIDRRSRQGISLIENDLPVNASYLDSIRKTGASVIYPTRWLNGAIIRATTTAWNAVNRLSCVRTDQNTRLNSVGGDILQKANDMAAPYSPTFTQGRGEETFGATAAQSQQIGIDKMHAKGFRGENMVIAVLDDGFYAVDSNPFLKNAKIVSTYDFVDNQNSVYEDGTGHGAGVFSVLAAYRDGEYIGTAHKASFHLFRTENHRSESRAEEAFWLAAAERADSLGVDIISNSSGYNTFDDATLNYKIADIDGKTALSTIAAEEAFRTGMLVVKSAGNEGNNLAWNRNITFPADGRNVLAVGSVSLTGAMSAFSSRGRTADGRVKPDVVALGESTNLVNFGGLVITSNGTSFAAPLVAGLAAGLWQANPALKNKELFDAIRQSGTRAKNISDSIGYGIPHFDRAQLLITSTETEDIDYQPIIVFPNPFVDNVSIYWQSPSKQAFCALHDLTGREVTRHYFAPNSHLETIQLPFDLPKGLYILQIGTQFFKIQKE